MFANKLIPMQRIILLLGLCLMVLLSACKKNYKCVCTATNGSVEFSISEAKKKEAQLACDVYKKQWSGTLSGTCLLQELPKE
jgi:hypothetical protein